MHRITQAGTAKQSNQFCEGKRQILVLGGRYTKRKSIASKVSQSYALSYKLK
jgi:hypothetical protein